MVEQLLAKIASQSRGIMKACTYLTGICIAPLRANKDRIALPFAIALGQYCKKETMFTECSLVIACRLGRIFPP